MHKLDRWLLGTADLWRADERKLDRRQAYWEKEVKRINCDLGFFLDFIATDSGKGRQNYFIFDVAEIAHYIQLLTEVKNLDYYDFKDKMQYIRSMIKETKERMLQSRIEAPSPVPGPFGEAGDDVVDLDVVGLEEDVELLLGKAIIHEEKGLQTLCIWGMNGIGKTTLARKLYNHESIVDGFEHRAWVHFPMGLSRKELLMKLIPQVVDRYKDEFERQELELMDNKTLGLMLCQHLQGMRYFIVFDDIWEGTDLDCLIYLALPIEDKGSRLLLTTRTYNIRPTVHYNHQMKFLDHDKSWELFLKVLSGTSDDHEFPKYLEKRGREIMFTKSNGLPLAVKEMGRQLAVKKHSGCEWEKLLLESTYLGETLAVLESSTFQKLHAIAKSCFLHLAFFKEGTAVRAKRLEQIWSSTGGVLVWLEVLLNESVIAIKDKTKDCEVKNYGINAIFHRLSIAKAEKIGLEILGKDGNNRPSDQEPCHRVIHCSRVKFNYSSTNQDKHLLSLFFQGGGYSDAGTLYDWNHFQQLRILDFEGFGLKILPETVGSLAELRYLGLRNNYIQELPQSLGRLKKLKFLDVALNFMVEVPDIIWEMVSLRHLYMSDILCPKPVKIDKLEKLETLTYISVDNWTYEVSGLEMMTRLHKLGIEELRASSDVSRLFASLAGLEELECLILRGFRFRSMPSLDDLRILHHLGELKLDGLLTKLPSADNFPPNIFFLTLVNTYLSEDPMPVLEKLPKLLYLKLQRAYTGEQMVISHNGFPELQIMCIGELGHLRDIKVGEGAMSKLKEMEINSCPYLETLPKEMIHYRELERLKMVTTRKIASKIRVLGLISTKIRQLDIQP
ncbi:hypothetical protein C2S52_007903 [Perilla frutescens var. hirtella]|nr:hypothetical protein C2S52_007903 [Perilla frutescens var. hirtella]